MTEPPAADADASPRAASAPPRRLLGPLADAPVTVYAGLATRTVAFGVDAALINGVAWVVGAIVALGLSLIGVSKDARTVLAAIGAAVALLWTFLYFVFFWSSSGQTPGNRVMGIRVQDAVSGDPISGRRAVVRVAALSLSALLLCTGFLLILVDRRRRALHDRLVRTVVVYASDGRRVRPAPPASLVNGNHGADGHRVGS